jgi:hypothetical protein
MFRSSLLLIFTLFLFPIQSAVVCFIAEIGQTDPARWSCQGDRGSPLPPFDLETADAHLCQIGHRPEAFSVEQACAADGLDLFVADCNSSSIAKIVDGVEQVDSQMKELGCTVAAPFGEKLAASPTGSKKGRLESA